MENLARAFWDSPPLTANIITGASGIIHDDLEVASLISDATLKSQMNNLGVQGGVYQALVAHLFRADLQALLSSRATKYFNEP
eukprot:7151515-Karenia_brevis.AAC.1